MGAHLVPATYQPRGLGPTAWSPHALIPSSVEEDDNGASLMRWWQRPNELLFGKHLEKLPENRKCNVSLGYYFELVFHSSL